MGKYVGMLQFILFVDMLLVQNLLHAVDAVDNGSQIGNGTDSSGRLALPLISQDGTEKKNFLVAAVTKHPLSNMDTPKESRAIDDVISVLVNKITPTKEVQLNSSSILNIYAEKETNVPQKKSDGTVKPLQNYPVLNNTVTDDHIYKSPNSGQTFPSSQNFNLIINTTMDNRFHKYDKDDYFGATTEKYHEMSKTLATTVPGPILIVVESTRTMGTQIVDMMKYSAQKNETYGNTSHVAIIAIDPLPRNYSFAIPNNLAQENKTGPVLPTMIIPEKKKIDPYKPYQPIYNGATGDQYDRGKGHLPKMGDTHPNFVHTIINTSLQLPTRNHTVVLPKLIPAQVILNIRNGLTNWSPKKTIQTIGGTTNFQWANKDSYIKPFYDHLSNNYESTDIFYLFTGDTQYWYDCTAENKNCFVVSNCSTYVGNREEVQRCQKLQGEYANRVQQKSVSDLNSLVNNITKKNVSGLILNGDLVMYGNESEIKRLNEQWLNYFPFAVYPGLGNHDNRNNVDKCPDQECLNRIMVYFIDYVMNRSKFSMDFKESYNLLLRKIIFDGSFSYSWDECSTSTCFHFVQLNYYPFYSTVIDSTDMKWLIRSSMTWLENDIRQNAKKPVIINFHAMDYSFTKNDKLEFVDLLKRVSKDVNILAIMFAHWHEKFGLKEIWCFNDGQTKIPLIYSGSVPANNYMMVQFSAGMKNVKYMYKVHAKNEVDNVVELLNLNQNCSEVH